MRITRLVLAALASLAVAASAQAAEPLAAAAPDAVESDAVASDAVASEPAAQRSVTMGPAVRDEQGREGRIHTVVPGDTLWDISEAYLGSPLVWPSVWKNNPAVANPHRIYPGNQIWISDTEMRPITKDEAAAAVPIASSGGEDAGVRMVGSFPVPHMERIGLVTAEEIETAGAILGSPEGEKWLGAHRRVWVSLGAGEVQVGDRFTVVRESERVRDPETRKTIGVHVEKLGWIEVTKVGPEAADAMIRVSTAEMQRGDRLIPRIEPSLEVPVRSTPASVEGQIALLPNERTITAQRDTIFLNRGTDDGLEVGAAIEVYRPGAVVRDRQTRIEHTLPDEIVANLIVVSAQPESAVAIATHATLELVRGDTFRTAPELTTSFRESSLPLDAAQWTARTIEGRDEGLPPSTPAKVAPAAGAK
jgi:hypothetical protein